MNKKIVIVLDNLKLGGIQRLALDEAYCFQDQGFEVFLLVGEYPKPGKSIVDADGEFFLKRKLEIAVMPHGLYKRFRFLCDYLLNINPTLVMCHTASINVILFLSRLTKKLSFSIHAFVHQLPTLSSHLQNTKRAIYFRFADQVSAVSIQFQQEINRLREDNVWYRLVFSPKIGFDRIGVYIPRLKTNQKKSFHQFTSADRPLLYLGRIIGWKGFPVFCKYVTEDYPSRSVVVITSPEIHQEYFDPSFFEVPHRHLYFSIGVSGISWSDGAVHLYPTDYGKETRFPMSIGINVLECIALGIPSIISYDNFDGWPELRTTVLCVTTDWQRSDLTSKIDHLSAMKISTLRAESERLISVVSIENHCLRNTIVS